ncbi:MAG TPA: MFS transporter [Chloroflexia bacterium]|nr:MFS transporter [Chloroflexia bacterium]
MQEKATIKGQVQVNEAVSEMSPLVVPLVMIASILVFSNMYSTQPVLPVIGAEFGLTPSTAGLTVSGLVLAMAASSIFYGLLSDRVGRKPVMVASVFGLSVPTLLCAIAPTFSLLVIFRVGQGLLIPGFTAITVTYLQEEMPPARRGMAIGYYVTATVAGGFTGRLFGGVLTDLAGNWRLSFYCFGLLDLVLAWMLLRYLPASRNFQSKISSSENSETPASLGNADSPITVVRFKPTTIINHLKNRQLMGVYMVGFSVMFCFLGIFTYLPYYLTLPPFNLSTLLISSAYTVYLVGMFSAPFSARLAERFGRRSIIQGGISLMLSGVLLTLVPALPLVVIGLVILCFGMFACQSTSTALVGESVRGASGRGSAVSLYQMFFYIGGSLGGFVPGLFWQSGGWMPVVVAELVVLGAGLASITWLYGRPE